MSPLFWQYVGIFSASLAAILIGLLLWRRRELRRMEAAECAAVVKAWGFDLLAKLLTAYSVGNYFGKDSVTRVVHEIIDEIRSGGLPAMLKKVGWKVVKGVFLTNAEDRKILADLLAATSPSLTVEPPAPLA